MEIDVSKLKRMQTLHVAFLLIDLREEVAFREGHIRGAFNIPKAEFLKRVGREVPKKDTPIVVYSEDGTGVEDILNPAENGGYINIVNLEGGFTDVKKLAPTILSCESK